MTDGPKQPGAERFRRQYESLRAVLRDDPLADLRASAFARFEELGLPGPKDEAWLYTSVAPIANGTFELGAPTTNTVGRTDLERIGVGGEAAARLVFLDGHFRADLSETGDLPGGVTVAGLAEALRGPAGDAVRERLGRQAAIDGHPFVALNTAMIADGAYVHVPRGIEVALPVHLLLLSTKGRASYPRHLVVVEDGARVTLVEHSASLGDDAHFTDAVTEVRVGRNARCDLVKLQTENPAALHVSALHVHQGDDSTFQCHTVTLGGSLVRNESTASLDGRNVHATLNGLYVARGREHVDNVTRLEHRKPHGESHELYKGILDDHARGAFTGRIHVYEDAQKTDAKQSNANLLLSEEAVADTRPQLEIYADDVKCTHGATVGQLDREALYYLRTRGIGHDEALRMLLHAFAGDIVERIGIEAVRDKVEALLEARLPHKLVAGY